MSNETSVSLIHLSVLNDKSGGVGISFISDHGLFWLCSDYPCLRLYETGLEGIQCLITPSNPPAC